MKKLLLIVLALLLTTATVAVAGDDWKDKDKDQAMEAAVQDMNTNLQVRMALLDKIGWDALDFGIEVEGDEIVLTGEAENRSNQELAKEVALSVDRVESVDNRITLKEAESSDTPVASAVADAEGEVRDAVADAEGEVRDAILETRVKSRLVAEMGANAFDIEVEASDGVVSLRGEVDSDSERQIALGTASETDGVERVVDLTDTRQSR